LPGVVTVVDATYASPYLLKPIKYGVDIVVHSGTKYLGGHSDLCAGVATARTVEQWKELLIARRVYGGLLSPYDASLLLRGLRTLHLRLERQCNTAQTLAEYLEAHDKVQTVFYPGLKSNQGYEIAKRQMRRFGAMISFELKGGLEAARTCVESVRLINLAVSLGGTESLIEHPATMTHGDMIMTDEERTTGNISDGLVRFSVGIEDVNDLIKDLQQALDKV
jgi:cystathionine beta-lyase/cystathionine gamma-synthase